jgi:hypothetical protein
MDEDILKLFLTEYSKFIEFIRNRDNEGVSEKFDTSISF